jgi:hypothetical protein
MMEELRSKHALKANHASDSIDNDLHSHLLRIYDSSAYASLDVFELIISRLQRAVRSTPSEALILTVNYEFACRMSGYFTEPNWESRFCDHLYYQRSRTHRTQTARHSYTIAGLLRGCHPLHFLDGVPSQPFRLCKRHITSDVSG